MWRRALIVILIVVPLEAAILFENPAATNTSAEEVTHRERIDKLIQRALVQFSLRLESQFDPTPGSNPNKVFSPLSIASVLAMVLLGAQGVTQVEVAQLLGVTAGVSLTGRTSSVHEELGRLLDTLEEHRVGNNETLVTIARGLFLQEDLRVNQNFINQATDIYRTEIQGVNFQHNPGEAKSIINQWVENRTRGYIKNLLQGGPDPSTQAVIASALYFIGQWENPFSLQLTKQKPFYVGKQAGSNQDEIVNVDLMVNGAKIPYYVDPERKCTIIGMPYKGNKMTMYVILPDEDVKTFTDNTDAEDLIHLVKKTEKKMVIFLFPRMRLESTINLVPPLTNMGIKTLFDSRTANLSNIAEGVFFNDAVHKVVIDISEHGTVAAAATAAVLNRVSPVVRVDKPFVFFIRDEKTGAILFWGTVIKPTPNYPVP